MAFDLNSIGSLVGAGGVSAISKRTKLPGEDVAKVLSAGIPALVGGMRRNAGAPEGAESLARALAEHSADDTSRPAAFLKNADLKDGKKILSHVLGADQKALVEQISRASGVTKGKTTTILALVAPLLLSLLGSQSNSGSGGLSGLLGGLLGGQQQSQQQSSGGLLGSLLGGSSAGNSSLVSGLFSSLLGGGGSAPQSAGNSIQLVEQPQQESSSGGLLDGLLNLFR
ncbi:MAG: DUF937 domain-containing protein [Oscillospiraceae bacterium]|nr:DUF937 domain-containing protein [Oscillospiraceae bacterium]